MMVEQMVSSDLSKYGLGKCTSVPTSSSDKQSAPLVSVKNTALRDVQMQNENKNGPPRPPDNSALQKEAVTQAHQAKGPPSSSNPTHNLVYARRKSESELSNSRTLDKHRTSAHQQSQKVDDKKYSPKTEPNIKVNDGKQSSAPLPVNSMATPVGACGNDQSAIVNSPVIEHWNSRFVQLQKYLKQCDSSNLEVYIQRLRTFTPDECSQHAVDLERRSIQLALEEGVEVERVKNLKILTGNYAIQSLGPVLKSE